MKITELPSIEDIEKLYESFKGCCHTSDSNLRCRCPQDGSDNGYAIECTESTSCTPSALEQLMAMEGLEDVKESIRMQLSYASVMKMRKEFGMKVPRRVFNIIFTGDPGTGKTTVGRLIGQIFHEHGLLSKGHTVETNRASLVGRYIGDTEAITSEKINEAKGGVLMIDEIYSLTSEVSETSGETRDFGVKVIDTLMPVLSDPESDVLVIGCGYKKQMTRFLKANPGLASRFPVVLDFANLSFDQLWNIMMARLQEFDCTVSESGADALHALIEKAMKVNSFGNGRFAVTLAESYLIPAVCHRIFMASVGETMTPERLKELSIVEAEDVPSFEKMFPLAGQKRAAVGFK